VEGGITPSEKGGYAKVSYRLCLNGMKIEREFKIINELGIHARVAVKIVDIANSYTSSLLMRKEDREVDAKNILSILSLGCQKGELVTFKANGDDAKELIERLELFFNEEIHRLEEDIKKDGKT